jgi:hypothetical protein
MATLKQIDANRRNSQHSTGPVTPEGKQAASLNALKTGIYAESEVIFTERREDLETLTTEYRVRFNPATPEARDLVDSLVRNAWLMRRFGATEPAIFDTPDQEIPTDRAIRFRLSNYRHELDMLQRRINSAERNYHRSLKALQNLEPPPAPPQPIETETTSQKLASFPQTQKKPSGEAAAPPPDPRIPTPDPLFSAPDPLSAAPNPQFPAPRQL